MKYYKSTGSLGGYKYHTYLEANELYTESELKDVLVPIYVTWLSCDLSEEQLEEMYSTAVDIQLEQVQEEEFMYEAVFNENTRVEVSLVMLANLDDVLYNVIRVYPEPVIGLPYGLYFGTHYADEVITDHLDVSSGDGTGYMECMKAAQTDIMTQLRRYFHATVSELKTALMAMSSVDPEEYEEMRAERETVLV